MDIAGIDIIKAGQGNRVGRQRELLRPVVLPEGSGWAEIEGGAE